MTPVPGRMFKSGRGVPIERQTPSRPEPKDMSNDRHLLSRRLLTAVVAGAVFLGASAGTAAAGPKSGSGPTTTTKTTTTTTTTDGAVFKNDGRKNR